MSISLVCEIVLKVIQMNTSCMTRLKTFTFLWLLSFGTCSTGIFKLDRLDRLKREITSFCLAVVRSVYDQEL